MTDTLPPPTDEAPASSDDTVPPTPGRPRFGCGWIPDLLEERASLPHTGTLLGAHAGVPYSARVVPHRPRPLDQQSTSACTGFSVWRAITTRLLRMGYKDFARLSVLAPYKFGQLLDQSGADVDGDGVVDMIPDDGARIFQVIASIMKWGVPREVDFPFSEEASTKVPPWKVRQLASTFKVTGVYTIDAPPGERTPFLKQAVAKGYPFVFGAPIDAAFEAWKGGDAPLEKIAKGSHPGHAMCVDAYEGDVFEIPNSWGESNGDFGIYRVTSSFLEDPRCSDFTVITVGPADPPKKSAEG